MFFKVLRIACGLLSVPFVWFVLFGSVFLVVANPSIRDVLNFYAISLVATVLAMTAAGFWQRFRLWQNGLIIVLGAASLMIVLPLLFWVLSIVPLILFG